MSRSLGDDYGKSLGVIETPIVTHLDNHFEDNYFVVLASDGIWDVMENDEVVNFVEQFRHSCRRNIEDFSDMADRETLYATSTCIAHILCEEARSRWFLIVENEDVTIDDISCIVLEMRPYERDIKLISELKLSPSMNFSDDDLLVPSPKKTDARRTAMFTTKLS
jgi:serine/threonine protein phosphatase PrpC